MSYDINMINPKTKDVIKFEEKHEFTGGMYVLGGTDEARLNITYNYGKYYYKHIDKEKGIRWLYGKIGKVCLPVLEKAIKVLGTNKDSDYWKSTPGNAGNALLGLIAFCKARPDGLFIGD